MAMRLAARSLGLMQTSAGFIRRGGNAGNSSIVSSKRSFSSSSNHDDAYETAKWEKITYLGIVSCTLLAAYNLSRGHPHSEEPPAYSYLHIRNKEFPWERHCLCRRIVVVYGFGGVLKRDGTLMDRMVSSKRSIQNIEFGLAT